MPDSFLARDIFEKYKNNEKINLSMPRNLPAPIQPESSMSAHDRQKYLQHQAALR